MPFDPQAVRELLALGQPVSVAPERRRLAVITARMPQALHAALKELAAEQRQSLNEWVVSTLWREAHLQLDFLDKVPD